MIVTQTSTACRYLMLTSQKWYRIETYSYSGILTGTYGLLIGLILKDLE